VVHALGDHAASVTQRIHDRMPEFGPDAEMTQQTVDTVAAIIAGFARMVLRGETRGRGHPG
jgi:hypothetical protein